MKKNKSNRLMGRWETVDGCKIIREVRGGEVERLEREDRLGKIVGYCIFLALLTFIVSIVIIIIN